MKNAYNIWLEKLKVRNNLEELSVAEKLTYEWVLENSVKRCGLDISGSG
jgi:hypothetical protein